MAALGSALVIHYTAKTLCGVLDWKLNAQQAADLPNFGSLKGPSLLEEKTPRPRRGAAHPQRRST